MTTNADGYRSGWCGQPDYEHQRCGISACTCPCHAINAAARPKEQETQQ